MDANINEEELRLLIYLHEHVRGFGQQFAKDAAATAASLDIDIHKLNRAASYLTEHGLAGFGQPQPDEDVRLRRYFRQADCIWLTGLGENYVRALEKAPGISRKLTISSLKELLVMGKSVVTSTAGQILAEFVKHSHF